MYFFYKKGRLVNMNKDKREKEDATKYGEFVSSYFGWVSPEKQKDRVDELEKITKKEDNNKNNYKKRDKKRKKIIKRF